MKRLRVLPWANIKRDTPEILFNSVLHLIKEHGHYEAAEKIMDYALPETHDKRQFTNYEFEVVANVSMGTSEGIYIDCFLRGNFDDSIDHSCKIGTFKTLEEGVVGYKIMGELSGLLVYYAHKYVDANLDRYSSDEELEQQAHYTNAPSELLERFNKLFRYHPITTTKSWTSFIYQSIENHSYQDFASRLEELVSGFEAVRANYGGEIAEAIYHNIHNNPAAPLLPEKLDIAAQHIKNGGSLDDLRWI